MLLLMFRVAESLYAVDAGRVVEVVPRVELRGRSRTPRRYLAGLLSYRGRVVPVVDLGAPAGRRRLPATGSSTRIILVEFTGRGRRGPAGSGWSPSTSATSGTSTTSQVVPPAMRLDEAPYLGAVVRTRRGAGPARRRRISCSRAGCKTRSTADAAEAGMTDRGDGRGAAAPRGSGSTPPSVGPG